MSAGLGYVYRHNMVVVILASLALLASCGRDSSADRDQNSNLVEGRLHPNRGEFSPDYQRAACSEGGYNDGGSAIGKRS